jgi:beta propeller repeat protein
MKKSKTVILFFFWAILITATPLFIPCYALTGTETLITTGTTGTNQQSPAVFGDLIAWSDGRNLTSFTNDIYVYNLLTGAEQRITISPDFASADLPSIYRDQIVWEDNRFGNADIFYYNLTSGQEIQITTDPGDQKSPAIYGVYIVYQDTSGADPDIWMYNCSNSTTVPITTAVQEQKSPVMYEGTIAWQDYRNGADWDIYLFNLTTGVEIPLIYLNDQTAPAIFGDKIVWQDNRNGDEDIYYYNLSDHTEHQVTYDPEDQVSPSVYQNYIVWSDTRNPRMVIYVYDISTYHETAITTPGSNAMTPQIYNNRIVWTDDRQGDSDIFLYTIGAHVQCPIASFTANPRVGGGGALHVTFTTPNNPAILHRVWNISDGSGLFPFDPAEPISTPGIFDVLLTVGNDKCRNATPPSCQHKIFFDAPPIVDFTASPQYGLAPLNVRFTDTSCGDPATWLWDFGDGATSTARNPSHAFSDIGRIYDISLTVNNSYAGMATNISQQAGYIITLLGGGGTSVIPIDGIAIDHRFGQPYLTYNISSLPNYHLDALSLSSLPPPSYGWQNLIFFPFDSIGLAQNSEGNITGNISTITFHTKDLTATNGTRTIGVNYKMNSSDDPGPAQITTGLWEGSRPDDAVVFRNFASQIPPTGFLINDIAQSAQITKTRLQAQGNATINMSVDTDWFDAHSGMGTIGIIGIGSLPDGTTVGFGINPVRHRIGGMDYFERESPGYLSKFALAQLYGAGNPFQLLTLSVSNRAAPASYNPGTETSDNPSAPLSITQGAAAEPVQLQAFPPPALPEAKTSDLYINYLGVVTQTTVLESADKLATVAIGQGVTALDASGKPLSSVSITTLASSEIPAVPQGTALDFAGIAFELQPDGATFSPSITVTFTVQNAQWGQHYAIREFDHTTQSWIDLPTTYNPASGSISASVTRFCCIALFSETINAPQTPRPATIATLIPAEVNSPPAGAIGIFTGLMLWSADVFTKNIYLVALVLAVMLFVYLKGRKKRLDRLRYKL